VTTAPENLPDERRINGLPAGDRLAALAVRPALERPLSPWAISIVPHRPD
jgi:hypothetical protein